MGEGARGAMVVTVIGTGNVGTHLTRALRKAGHETTALAGRTFRREDVRGEVVIVCVKDDALPDVGQRLAGLPQLVVHTAGSMPLEALPCPRRGVLYPMQTFSKRREVDFGEVPLFLETEKEEDMRLLELLARSLSRSVYRMDSEGRKRLHLAAVFASNFTNHCYALAADILNEGGIPFEVMLPLTDEVARKVHEMGPGEAQTGPARRGDEGVMQRHEAMLEGRQREIYHLLSQSIAEGKSEK